jgi:hypothetical protein
MNANQTYAVYTCAQGSSEAETDMTAHDVVRHIYRDDGGDYRLELKMLTHRYDDEDNELPDIQETTESGDLVFELWFKDCGSRPFYKAHRIAIGKNEDEAEENFLQDSFECSMWDDSRWIVVTTEQYLAEQAENAAKVAVETEED